MTRTSRAWWTVGWFALCAVGVARAESRDTVVVEAPPGSCPSGSAVAILVAGIVGEAALEPEARPPDHRALVADHGDRWSVRIDGRTRRFADPARRCDERARAAAVLIALAVAPDAVPTQPPLPQLPVELPESPPPRVIVETAPSPGRSPPATAATPPVVSAAPPDERPSARSSSASPVAGTVAREAPERAPRRRDVAVSLELDLRLGLGAGASPSAFVVGGAARLAIGRRWPGWRAEGILDAGATAPTTLDYGSASAAVTPLVLGLGARGVRVGNHLSVGFEAALAPMLLHVVGERVAQPRDEWRGELGLRGALTLGGPSRWRVIPTARLEATWVPDAHDLSLTDGTIVGRLPAAWVSLLVGATVPLR